MGYFAVQKQAANMKHEAKKEMGNFFSRPPMLRTHWAIGAACGADHLGHSLPGAWEAGGAGEADRSSPGPFVSRGLVREGGFLLPSPLFA